MPFLFLVVACRHGRLHFYFLLYPLRRSHCSRFADSTYFLSLYPTTSVICYCIIETNTRGERSLQRFLFLFILIHFGSTWRRRFYGGKGPAWARRRFRSSRSAAWGQGICSVSVLDIWTCKGLRIHRSFHAHRYSNQDFATLKSFTMTSLHHATVKKASPPSTSLFAKSKAK